MLELKNLVISTIFDHQKLATFNWEIDHFNNPYIHDDKPKYSTFIDFNDNSHKFLLIAQPKDGIACMPNYISISLLRMNPQGEQVKVWLRITILNDAGDRFYSKGIESILLMRLNY